MYSYVLIIMYLFLPGRALRTRFFMYYCAFVLMYSFTRTRPPHQILNLFYNPDAPSALDFLCILMYLFFCILIILMYYYVFCKPGRANRTRFCMFYGFDLWLILCYLCLSFIIYRLLLISSENIKQQSQQQ